MQIPIVNQAQALPAANPIVTPPLPKAALSVAYDDDDWYGQYCKPAAAKGTTTGVGVGSSYTYTPVAQCHTGNVHVFDYVNQGVTLSFSAGGTTRGSVQQMGQVLIALQSHDDGDFTAVSTQGITIPGLSKYVPRIIHIDVADQTAPKLPLGFWYDLLAGLTAVAKKEPSKKLEVLVRCAGGHGRTGTVMAVLAWLCEATKGDEPVAWLRKVFCKEVVESNAQFNYIQRMTGQVSKETTHPFASVAVSQPYQYQKAGTSPLPGVSLPPVKGSTVEPKPVTGVMPTGEATPPTTTLPVNSGTITLKPAEVTDLLPPQWEGVKKLYIPDWPTRVEWDDKCFRWQYYYADGGRITSRYSPLICGINVDGVIEQLEILKVTYGLTTCAVTFDAKKGGTYVTETYTEERPEEESLESVEYNDKGACWEYTLLGNDDFPILLHLDPTVFGTELVAGKWKGAGATDPDDGVFVESVLYTGDDSIEVNLLNHITVYLERNEGGEIKTTTGPTIADVVAGI